MATLLPSFIPAQAQTGGWHREQDTLERLVLSLPDAYTVFHNLDFAASKPTTDAHGEIDIIIMNQAGDLLLAEVKSGDVEFRDTGIYKRYGRTERRVDGQVRYQYSAMRARLNQAGLAVTLNTCLVLPDYRIGDQQTMAMPRDRIVDATGFDQLGSFVRSVLPVGTPHPNAQKVQAFLMDELEIIKDFSVLNQQVRKSNTRMSGGLASWVPRISSPSGTLVVSGTAGSGKTLLAIRLLERAAEAGHKALYVCFNRSLADSMARNAPSQAVVATFHELCVEHFEREAGKMDFSQPDAFSAPVRHYIDHLNSADARFDVLIIDEAQDFEVEWVEALTVTLKDSGMLYLLQDDAQRLYDRPVFDCTNAVVVESHENFRSPRAVVGAINMFGLTDRPVQPRSVYEGSEIQTVVYDKGNAGSLARQTADAIAGCLEKGFKPDEIVVLSLRGLKSTALATDTIGTHRMRRFTGRFDDSKNPVWTDGDIVFDSIYRFKGQSAPAVIVSEIDFDDLGERERNKLFVAMTRAEIHLSMIMTEDAHARLMAAAGL